MFKIVVQGLGVPIKSGPLYGEESAVLELHSNTRELPRKMHTGLGFFTQLRVPSISMALSIMRQKIQTLISLGFEKADLVKALEKADSHCVNRIEVPGHALDLHEIWDGRDLISRFSKK